jgi:hypothetical protein
MCRDLNGPELIAKTWDDPVVVPNEAEIPT